MTTKPITPDTLQFDLFLCFDSSGIIVRESLSKESAHLQQKRISSKSVRRRPFRGEEPASALFGTNAWLVGDKAEALAHVFPDLPDTSKVLLDRPSLFVSKAEEDAVWKDGPIVIGMVEQARKIFASAIDAIGKPKTLVLLSGDLAMLGREGAWREDPTPPLWLIYALRRYKWPGEVWLKVEKDPAKRSDSKENINIQPDGRLLLTPNLPAKVGAWDTSLFKTEVRSDLYVSLQTPAQSSPIKIAPIGSVLPVVETVSFVDQDGPELPLVIRYSVLSSNGQRSIEVKRDNKSGFYAAYVPQEFAPRRRAIPYVVTARVDEWGDVSIAISTSQGERLPLEVGNAPLPQGQTKSSNMFSRLVLDRLCFPNATSFPVASWDAMSINGEPPANQIAQIERPTLLDRRELIRRSRPEPEDIVQIDRAKAVLIQEAEATDTAALVSIKLTLFEWLQNLAYNFLRRWTGQEGAQLNYQARRLESLIAKKRIVWFPDTPDAEHLNWEVSGNPEEILEIFCPPNLLTAISDMTPVSPSSPQGLDNP